MVTFEPKLKGGMIIRVVARVLHGLKPGEYRVAYAHHSVAGPVYAFAKPRGRKIICSYLADTFDVFVGDGIEVIKNAPSS